MGLFRLMYQAATGRYTPVGSLDSADCIVGQAFGLTKTNGGYAPGRSNEALADDFIARVPLALPAYLQDELYQAVVFRSGERIQGVTPIRPRELYRVGWSGERIMSYKLLEIELQAAISDGHKHIALWAEAHHMPRFHATAKKTLKKEGIDDVELIVPAGLPACFDPESIQPWTRNKWLWAAKELVVVIPLHVLARKI